MGLVCYFSEGRDYLNKLQGGTRPGHQEKGHQQHDGRMKKTFTRARSRHIINNYNKKPLFADVYYGGTKYSFTSSYVKNDVAILGATFTAALSATAATHRYSHLRRLGQSPLYNPEIPSTLSMLLKASMAPLYLIDPPCIPDTCIFRRSTSNGYVSVCDIHPKQSLSARQGFKPPILPTSQCTATQFPRNTALSRRRNNPSQKFIRCEIDPNIWCNTKRSRH